MTPATIQTHFEADNEKIVLRWVDTNGAVISSRGSAIIDLKDLRALMISDGLSATNLEMKIRIEYAHGEPTCALKKRAIFASDWQPA